MFTFSKWNKAVFTSVIQSCARYMPDFQIFLHNDWEFKMNTNSPYSFCHIAINYYFSKSTPYARINTVAEKFNTFLNVQALPTTYSNICVNGFYSGVL